MRGQSGRQKSEITLRQKAYRYDAVVVLRRIHVALPNARFADDRDLRRVEGLAIRRWPNGAYHSGMRGVLERHSLLKQPWIDVMYHAPIDREPSTAARRQSRTRRYGRSLGSWWVLPLCRGITKRCRLVSIVSVLICSPQRYIGDQASKRWQRRGCGLVCHRPTHDAWVGQRTTHYARLEKLTGIPARRLNTLSEGGSVSRAEVDALARAWCVSTADLIASMPDPSIVID